MKDIPIKIFLIIAAGFILRTIAGFYFIDLNNNYYWEYGEIAKNVLSGQGYSLFYYSGNELNHLFNYSSNAFPSAYMPPGYTYFLLPFIALNNPPIANIFLILIHSLLGGLSVLLLYKITIKFYNEITAIISVLIGTILPEFIYAVTSFTPTVLFHFFILLFFWLFLKPNKNTNLIIYLSLIFAVLIYLRGELLLFIIPVFIYLIKDFGIKRSLLFVSILFLLISPWLIRNKIVFDEFPLLTTNTGMNLYRGNNTEDVGGWGEEKINNKIYELKKDNHFEVSMNKLLTAESINYISDNPGIFIKRSAIKFIQLWTITTNDSRAKSIIYVISSIFLILFFLIGIYAGFDKKKFGLFYLFFLYYSIISMVFFVQPRYQTMIRILMIPFVSFGFYYIINYLKEMFSRK